MRKHPPRILLVDQIMQIVLLRPQRAHQPLPRPRVVRRVLIRGIFAVVVRVVHVAENGLRVRVAVCGRGFGWRVRWVCSGVGAERGVEEGERGVKGCGFREEGYEEAWGEGGEVFLSLREGGQFISWAFRVGKGSLPLLPKRLRLRRSS